MRNFLKPGLLLIAFLSSLSYLQSAEHNTVDEIFESLNSRSSIYASDILTDLQKIDGIITEDYEKNKLPDLMAHLGSQRGVYSLSMMDNEILEKICRDSTYPIFVQNLHQVKVAYLNILKENALVNSDDLNLYHYLLGSL